MRKRFQPRANVPMMSETRKHLALELYTSVETLLALPSEALFNRVSCMFAALQRAGLDDPALDTGSHALNTACDRYVAGDPLHFNDEEAGQLRKSAAGIDQLLYRVPLNRFDQAVAEVKAYQMMLGAKV